MLQVLQVLQDAVTVVEWPSDHVVVAAAVGDVTL